MGTCNEDVIAAYWYAARGSGADPLAHSVERIILLEHDIDDMIGSFVDTRDEITAAIAQVEDGRYRLLLHCRYILGLGWGEIGNECTTTLAGCSFTGTHFSQYSTSSTSAQKTAWKIILYLWYS